MSDMGAYLERIAAVGRGIDAELAGNMVQVLWDAERFNQLDPDVRRAVLTILYGVKVDSLSDEVRTLVRTMWNALALPAEVTSEELQWARDLVVRSGLVSVDIPPPEASLN